MTIRKMSLMSALTSLFLLVVMLASSGTASAHTANGCQPQQVFPPCTPSHFHDLYWTNGSQIWGYNGTSTDLIDDSQIGLTNGNQVSGQFGGIFAVLAHGGNVYEVRRNLNSGKDFLFAVVYGGCTTTTGYCLTELDDSYVNYVAAGTVGLYESRSDGVWQSTGLCMGCWTKIGNRPGLLVASSHLYVMSFDTLGGTTDDMVWRYNGTPNNWTEVDNTLTASLNLAIDTHNVLYELSQVYNNGQLAISHVLQGHGPNNFQLIGWGNLTNKIVADRRLYEWNADDSIQLYQGTPNNWAYVLASPGAKDVEAGANSDAVYWQPVDNSIWRYSPETGASAIVGPSDNTLQMSQQGVLLHKFLLL